MKVQQMKEIMKKMLTAAEMDYRRRDATKSGRKNCQRND